MNNFFKLDRSKVIATVLIGGAGYLLAFLWGMQALGGISNVGKVFYALLTIPFYIINFHFIYIDAFNIAILPVFPIAGLVWWYLLSCVLVWAYRQLRNKN